MKKPEINKSELYSFTLGCVSSALSNDKYDHMNMWLWSMFLLRCKKYRYSQIKPSLKLISNLEILKVW